MRKFHAAANAMIILGQIYREIDVSKKILESQLFPSRSKIQVSSMEFE